MLDSSGNMRSTEKALCVLNTDSVQALRVITEQRVWIKGRLYSHGGLSWHLCSAHALSKGPHETETDCVLQLPPYKLGCVRPGIRAALALWNPVHEGKTPLFVATAHHTRMVTSP